MNVTLQGLSKSKNNAGRSTAKYIATFRIDGKICRFHATVAAREGHSIRFKERAIDGLLAHNMDQGRKVYRAIHDLHLNRSPKLPLALGDLNERSSTALPAFAAH